MAVTKCHGRGLLTYTSTLSEGMKFTQSCFRLHRIIRRQSSCMCKSTGSTGTASIEPGTSTELREIDIRHQRSSVPSKSLKDGPKTAVSCLCLSKNKCCK